MLPSPSRLISLAVLVALVALPLVYLARLYGVREHLRSARRLLRLDAVALAVGSILAVGCGAVWYAVATLQAPVRSTAIVLLFGAAVACLTVAVANRDWYRASRSVSVVDPGAVEPGPVAVSGRAVALEDGEEHGGEPEPSTTASSVTQTDSLAYRAVTREERAVAGRGYAGSRWVPRSAAFDAVDFRIEGPASAREDETGTGPDATVTVDADAAEFPLLSPTSSLLDVSPAREHLDGLERTVPAEPGTTVPITDDLGQGARPRPRRYTERRIDPGDEVSVLGTAVQTDDGIEVRADPDGPPLIVARAPPELVDAHVRRLVVGLGKLGTAALATGLALAGTLAF